MKPCKDKPCVHIVVPDPSHLLVCAHANDLRLCGRVGVRQKARRLRTRVRQQDRVAVQHAPLCATCTVIEQFMRQFDIPKLRAIFEQTNITLAMAFRGRRIVTKEVFGSEACSIHVQFYSSKVA